MQQSLGRTPTPHGTLVPMTTYFDIGEEMMRFEYERLGKLAIPNCSGRNPITRMFFICRHGVAMLDGGECWPAHAGFGRLRLTFRIRLFRKLQSCPMRLRPPFDAITCMQAEHHSMSMTADRIGELVEVGRGVVPRVSACASR